MLESPTNPRMQVCDLKACALVAKEAGAVVVVDNSMMPLVVRSCHPCMRLCGWHIVFHSTSAGRDWGHATRRLKIAHRSLAQHPCGSYTLPHLSW